MIPCDTPRRHRWRSPLGYTVLALLAFGLALIPTPPASADAAITEGDRGTVDAVVVVSLSAPESGPVYVDYSTSDGTASASEDYQATGGTVTFQPGETRKLVHVPVKGDAVPEKDETFFLNLTRTSAPPSDTQATVTIVDDDPSISIANVSVTEGDAGEVDAGFVVTLSRSKSRGVTVRYATADGTAGAGSDYQSTRGRLRFPPGATSKVLRVPIVPDQLPEANETFFVHLFNPNRAQITGAQGTGTIANDDASVAPQEPGPPSPGGPPGG